MRSLSASAAGRTTRLGWIWAQVTSRLGFRISLYGLAALATALVAVRVAPFVPLEVQDRIREGAAREILSIMASSMLVVATFALAAMVQAFAAASQAATPRATAVLIDDRVSQNVLGTFLGAFVFSIVGLLAHSVSYYGPGGEAVLMGATAVVIVAVIATFFGWLDHLANLVRLGETIGKVERRAAAVLQGRARAPRLGGVAPTDPRPAWAVLAAGTGYVRHVDMAALQEAAATAGGRISVAATPGALADPVSALAFTDWPADEEEAEAVRAAFSIGAERSFDQDPRFSVAVLAEIASRALSPGVNDPGTAILVIATLQRLLADWAATPPEEGEPRYPAVTAPELAAEDLIEDAFGPLRRDAAPILEAGLRLQKSLAALAAGAPRVFGAAAAACSAGALAHAEEALPVAVDRARLAAAAAALGRGGEGTR
jgi:uncharacterized membrane protein